MAKAAFAALCDFERATERLGGLLGIRRRSKSPEIVSKNCGRRLGADFLFRRAPRLLAMVERAFNVAGAESGHIFLVFAFVIGLRAVNADKESRKDGKYKNTQKRPPFFAEILTILPGGGKWSLPPAKLLRSLLSKALLEPRLRQIGTGEIYGWDRPIL